jgi:hypothetical protein
MMIEVRCACGKIGQARQEFAGRRAQCPACGRVLPIPESGPPPITEAAAALATALPAGAASSPAAAAEPFREYLDPPSAPIAKKIKTISVRRMFEALLDPQSIQWMLMLGGGLAILGLIVVLTSIGIFKDKYVLAAALGLGTLGVLGAGWFVALKTRYRVAGQALTFLGCVVAPLNLWFYQSQGLLTVHSGLWMGGLVCCLLYAATVYVLRDPLFMYAVEVGVTLTASLLLPELAVEEQTISYACLLIMALGLISIHGERAFPPDAPIFDRRRFGMPLFWSGHVQLAASLVVLVAFQALGWLYDLTPLKELLEAPWAQKLLEQSIVQHTLLAGAMWLAGTYAYLYSDIVVRRVGVYTFLAAFCFLLAEVTFVDLTWLDAEWLIAALALTALAATLVQAFLAAPSEKVNRAVPPLAMALGCLPIFLGIALHFRASSELDGHWGWEQRPTGWLFVAVMVLVAGCNRVSAYLCRQTAPKWSAAYFFGSAAAALVAAAGLLRVRPFGLETWIQQAPWLMLLPIAYLVAGRLWRGHSPERPLGWVAQAATAVILIGVLVASLHNEALRAFVQPGAKVQIAAPVAQAGQQVLFNPTLIWGLVFTEAALFYALAAIFRRRSVNLYFAAAAACGAMWQFLGYCEVQPVFHTMLFAVLGVALLAIARAMGIERVAVYRPTGEEGTGTRGKGLVAFQAGNAVVTIALLTAFLQGLSRIATNSREPWSILALILTTLASLAAIGFAPSGMWRRWYATSTVAMTCLTFLTVSLWSQLSNWQKLEIFCTATGVLLVAVSYVGRFREDDSKENETVTWGLFLGSVLATMPLLVAVIHWHFFTTDVSLIDELALITITIAMLVTGFGWQIRSTTFFGGTVFGLYLLMLLVDLGRHQAVGVYLAIAGGVVFLLGVLLSVYRERLLTLPEQIAKREGIFKVLEWR